MSIRRDIQRIALTMLETILPSKQTLFRLELPQFPKPKKRSLTKLPEIVIATPFKDASNFLSGYFDLIDGLDYPKDRMHLIMLEGDSRDNGLAMARTFLAQRERAYASTRLIKLDLNVSLGDGPRQDEEIQLRRRSAIAKCRNRLLSAALQTNAEHILFVDVDMAVIPPDSLRQLLHWDAPIMMANCLHPNGDNPFDLNAFRYTRLLTDRLVRAFVIDGLYQPPAGFFRHYPAVTGPDSIEAIHSVGGTFLLVRRDVIEAGVNFPEEPYHLHIETEGFALKAAQVGFGSFMATGLVTRHRER